MEPPTARFVVQLFLIPLAIVIVLVVGLSLVYLAFGSLATGGHQASEYVDAIRTGNENRRWRAATDLASLIHNDAKLAADPRLATDLADLLAAELGAKRTTDTRVAQFLALALGAMNLSEPTTGDSVGDAVGILIRALGQENPQDVRIAAITGLAQQISRADWIRQSDEVSRAVLASCTDPDEQVRQRAVYAIGVFPGAEPQTMLRRMVSDPDRLVRFNAAAALAKQGDLAALEVLREMLSTADLAQVIKSDSPGQDERQIQAIQLEALGSLREGLRAGNSALAARVKPDLEQLTRTGSPPVQLEAASILKVLPSNPSADPTPP